MSETRHYLPEEIVRHAVNLKTVLDLSYRTAQLMLRARGAAVSHEAIRSWVGSAEAPAHLPLLPVASLWRPQVRPIVVRREVRYLWTAVDQDGAVGELLLQPRRNDALAMRRLQAGLAEQRALSRRRGGGPVPG